MIQATNLGEMSSAISAPLVRAPRVDSPDAPAKPADTVDLQTANKAKSSSSSSRTSSSKRSSKSRSSSSKKTGKTEAAKGPQLSPYEKASQKFLGSLVALQGCSDGDRKFVENAIVGIHQLDKLDGDQKQFVMAQGLGKYAIGELSKMSQSHDPAAAAAEDKRWNALTNVIKTAKTMVNAFPASSVAVPQTADFSSGDAGSGLLNGTSSTTAAPANGSGGTAAPTPGSAPAPGASGGAPTSPPANADQAAKDDYNAAMKIYQQTIADRQKNMADINKIYQDMQTSILTSISNIWAGWAKVFSDGIANYNRVLGYDGVPKDW